MSAVSKRVWGSNSIGSTRAVRSAAVCARTCGCKQSITARQVESRARRADERRREVGRAFCRGGSRCGDCRQQKVASMV
eukprot:1674818-Rhodomonas_salina.2